ncbi:uncharacterized protein N7459_005184 [Penicillium hispanicum]|uniref:uncharacterized protein n=1 Tax=Penicillium hispanicum TaxID=1080232 RepID=UPI0025404BF4|nr:uncharacterized protein N7459_005184 [Penicillium hispanicum]KAJ5585384.1 hypothetical protein N7459_005184 [Penicillium hispanicum]
MASHSKPSLSEADRIQITTRSKYRGMLQVIQDTICDAEAHQLESSVLEKAGVLRQPLALDENSKCKPFFFDRFREALEDMTDPNDPVLTRYVPDREDHDNVRGVHHFTERYIVDHEPVGVPGSYSASWGKINCGGLFETIFHWKASMIALPVNHPEAWPYPPPEPTNPPLPHVKCLMESWVIGDDRLLRGEIKAIIRIMRSRLYARKLRPHLTAPVMVFSTVGPWHLRILEAYFDGSKLVVRNTPLYDMRDHCEDEAFMQDICRWWYGSCIGNTNVVHANDRLA